MVEQFVAALERPISRARLESYRSGDGGDFAMLVNYFYNIELSEAIYPSLHIFEISLRNSIDHALAQHFETHYWFDIPGLLLRWQQEEISRSRTSLSNSGKTHDPGRIIAELKLGFWHSLFNAPFERQLWRPKKSAMIGSVFPQIPRRNRNRRIVYDRIDRIRKLRNRVMHFEPIWNRSQIAMDHALILESIQWISTEMSETLALSDRFDDFLTHGRETVEQRISIEIQRRFPQAPHPGH